MKCGIVGPPLSGKTTIFKLLTGIEVNADSGRREIQQGIAQLPDKRLDKLTELYAARKTVYATVEYMDVPGFASSGDGTEPYPAKYLADLKTADALMLVIRKFTNPMVPEPASGISPENDIISANLEFILSDMQTIEKRLERLKKNKETVSPLEQPLLEKCLKVLSDEKGIRTLELSEDEQRTIKHFAFLSQKPMLIVININDDEATEAEAYVSQLKESTGLGDKDIRWVVCAAKLEEEIMHLDPADRAMFLSDLGFTEPALERIVHHSFDLMKLMTFLTAGEKETRAWVIRHHSTAVEASSAIHNDLARGFIRAEVCKWDELIEAGSTAKLKEKGKLRLEGKDYIVQDGDVLNIRFNV